MAEPVLVFVSAQILEVQSVRSALAAEGIEAFVVDDNIPRMNPFYTMAVGGIKLFVAAKDAPEAAQLLRKLLNVSGDLPFSGALSPFAGSVLTERVQPQLSNEELTAEALNADPVAPKLKKLKISFPGVVLGLLLFVLGGIFLREITQFQSPGSDEAYGRAYPSPSVPKNDPPPPDPRDYVQDIQQRVYKTWSAAIPKDAKVFNFNLTFKIIASGYLEYAKLDTSSGDRRLDQLALDTVNKLSPFPPLPPFYVQKGLIVHLNLKSKSEGGAS